MDELKTFTPEVSNDAWETFSGFSKELGQEVSVTVVHARTLRAEHVRKKFVAMSQAAAGMVHPVVQRTLRVEGLADGRWRIVSERLSGPTLADVLAQEGPLSAAESVDLAGQLCEAAEAGHRRGVTHGDINPKNVFLVGGRQALKPKLANFAVAIARAAAEVTLSEGFAAPELAAVREPTVAADVYSLGAVVYAMLTGSSPDGRGGRPFDRFPASAARLGEPLRRCLDPDPARRFSTAREFGDALKKALAAPVPVRPEESLATRVGPPPVPAPSEGNEQPAATATSAAAYGVGKALGPYELIGLLGEGAMGQVFLGRHKLLGRQAAIKLLRPELYKKDTQVQRFFQEARTVNQINHVHIVEILDFVQELGPNGPSAVYCVMEWLQGQTLTALGEKAPVPIHRGLTIVRQICDALAAAHRVGVVHRDVKPDNIFLCTRDGNPDYVKVLDFGIAKLTAAGSDAPAIATMDGTILGTPITMAPEQAAGKTVDHRADIYAVGVVLYWLLSGKLPFMASNFAALAVKVIKQPPPPLPHLTASGEPFPGELKALVLKCLSKDPAERPQSMDAIGAALEPLLALQTTTPALAVPPLRRKTAGLPASRKWWPVGLAIVTLAALGGGGLYWTTHEERGGDAPEREDPPEPPPTPIKVVAPGQVDEAAKSYQQCFLRWDPDDKTEVRQFDVRYSFGPGGVVQAARTTSQGLSTELVRCIETAMVGRRMEPWNPEGFTVSYSHTPRHGPR